ncbi:hypothetical protein GCM10027398_21760 [Azotobacter salinestris]
MKQIRLGSGQLVTVAHAGFAQAYVAIHFPDGLRRTMPGVISGALAGELLKMLRPEFPGCTLSISRIPRELRNFPEAERESDRVKDLVIRLRGSHRPGHEFLRLIGYFGPDAKPLPHAKLRA